jgi:cell division protein FtsL
MGRILNVLLLGGMIAGAVATYDLKHHGEEVADRVARLDANIGKEREAIALLNTEWSVLTQPSRLQDLVAKYQDHFKLEPFAVSQVATLDEIPMRPVEPPKRETAMASTPPNAAAR